MQMQVQMHPPRRNQVQVQMQMPHLHLHLQMQVHLSTSLSGAETWATTRGQEARQEVHQMRMLRWMGGVTRRDTIRNEHIRGTTRVVQASKKITEKRLKWYRHVRRMKEEHIVRRMLDVDIPGKRRRGRPNLRWKYACKRDVTQVGLKTTRQTGQH